MYNYGIESDVPWEFFWSVFYAILFISLAIGLVFYVFQSIGLYTLAKRRGVRYPGLAWVPIGSNWILGCLADQFDSVSRRKRSAQRHALLWLPVGMLVAVFVELIIILPPTFATLPRFWNDNIYQNALSDTIYHYLPVILACYFVILGTAITYMIFHYIALYKVYKSCNPDTAIAFLLLSIFVSVTMPFLIFAGRKEDLGMTPPNGTYERSL